MRNSRSIDRYFKTFERNERKKKKKNIQRKQINNKLAPNKSCGSSSSIKFSLRNDDRCYDQTWSLSNVRIAIAKTKTIYYSSLRRHNKLQFSLFDLHCNKDRTRKIEFRPNVFSFINETVLHIHIYISNENDDWTHSLTYMRMRIYILARIEETRNVLFLF